jgi:hypothetical protein
VGRVEQFQGTLANLRGEETARGRETERKTHLFTREYPQGLVVTRQALFTDVTPSGLTVGEAEDRERRGTHRVLYDKQAEAFRAGISAKDTVKRIHDLGTEMFTGASRAGVAWQGLKAALAKPFDTGTGQAARNLQQTSGEAFKFVRLMQGAGVVSNADLDIIRDFLSNESLMQSKEGFAYRVGVVGRVVETGLWRLANGFQVDPGGGVSMDWLKSTKPATKDKDGEWR